MSPICHVCLQDAWSDSQGKVTLDSQQNYELIEAKWKSGGFYLLFKRPFSTCDPRDYLIEVTLLISVRLTVLKLNSTKIASRLIDKIRCFIF